MTTFDDRHRTGNSMEQLVGEWLTGQGIEWMPWGHGHAGCDTDPDIAILGDPLSPVPTAFIDVKTTLNPSAPRISVSFGAVQHYRALRQRAFVAWTDLDGMLRYWQADEFPARADHPGSADGSDRPFFLVPKSHGHVLTRAVLL